MLVCPECSGELLAGADFLHCAECGPFPVLHDVPVLIRGTKIHRRARLPAAGFAEDVAVSASPGLPDGATERLRSAFSNAFTFDNPIIQSESGQFVSRLRSSGVSVRDPYPLASPKAERFWTRWVRGRKIKSTRVAGRIVTFPREFPAARYATFNVQIENIGESILSSKGDQPFCIAYWLIGEGGEKIEGDRTKLLIDLEPGRAITQPIRVLAPDAPGHYTLRLQPLVEGVSWLDCIDERLASVSAGVPEPEFGWEVTEHQRSYEDDHRAAIGLLNGWLGESDAPIIEIGGNYRPTSARAGRKVVNIDVDPFGLLASRILHGHKEDVQHVVGDGMRLPLADGSVEAVVLFATFHHFPDPVALLRHIRSKLSPTGKLFLLCEPVGHVFVEYPPGGYIHELEQGAYEQSFLPWEYAQLLDEGGFSVAGGVFDVGSAKIVAVPRLG